ASTLKSPSYTKSVSWQHYRFRQYYVPGCVARSQ
ncbi:transposase, partial [Shigella flexneri]